MTKNNYPEKMKAVVAYAPGDYKYETVDTPTLENDKEIIVKVEACGNKKKKKKHIAKHQVIGVTKHNLHTLKHQ